MSKGADGRRPSSLKCEPFTQTILVAARARSGLSHKPRPVEILPEVPQQVVGDAGRLRQVLVNLVGNAIKFTQQGEVLVRVERVASEGSGLQLKFTISDTGIGIALEKQSLIFEAFTQADNSMSRSYERTRPSWVALIVIIGRLRQTRA